MTTDKLKEVLRRYQDMLYSIQFDGAPVVAKELDAQWYDGLVIPRIDLAAHLLWMCNRCLDVFIPIGEANGTDEDIDKAKVWLGYIQGELRGLGLYTITDLRNHNRQKKE